MKKVVCIGGGTGQSALLRGLKQIDDIELSTIVAVADDGGSTGRLREDFNIPAMGDVRNVMVSLASSEDLMTKIMTYRFGENDGVLAGHNLGNIIISGLTKDCNNFLQAITSLSEVLKVKGTIYPCTTESVTLSAHMSDGSVIDGETQIRESKIGINDVFYKNDVHTYPNVIKAINNADYIIIGIGSLYTSILPNLIIGDIREALCNCPGKVIYYCNCMTEPGETDGYTLEEHVKVIEKNMSERVIDAVVVNNYQIPLEYLERYRLAGSEEVIISQIDHNYRIFSHPLLVFDKGVIRHDANKVRDSFKAIMKEI